MRKVPLAGAAAALVLGLAGVVAFSVASQAAGSSAAPRRGNLMRQARRLA